ncbi:MAG: radical SAM protein [Methanoregula sp.]|nr:radical SAM protein [Methanoregula sp.]
MTDTTPHSPYVVTVNAASWDIWKDTTPLLPSLDVELTERCNNNCIHCCINRPEDDAVSHQETPTEDLKRILREAAGLGALSVRFTGGEPLLHKEFTGLYLFARGLGLNVVLFTNARCITTEIADLFTRVPPRELIEVTVYGMTKKSYEAVSRVKGSYEEFRRGVDLLADRKIPFVVKSVFLPQNRGDVIPLEKWASAIPAMNVGPSHSLLFDLRCRRDSPSNNRRIRSLRLSPEEYISFISQNRDSYERAMEMFCSRFMRAPGEKIFACGAGLGGCVDAYGMLQPCLMIRHPSTLYDLKKGSLQDALTRFFPRLREAKSSNPAYLSRCARCFLKGLCEQCPAKSWMEHGTLDTPVEYFCEIAHAQARDLGLIFPGENAWEVTDGSLRVMAFSERIYSRTIKRDSEFK